MFKWLLLPLLALVIALVPSVVAAEDGDDDKGVLIRIDGDVIVARDEVVSSVVVINGNATIEGTVRDSVLVIDGDATVSGAIEGDVTVISGDVNLRAGSSVDNVHSIDGNVLRADGATVTGDINQRDGFGSFGWIGALFSIVFWLGMTVAIIAAGFIFAAIGGRQLTEATRTMTGDAVNAILGVVFVWVAVPIIAVIAIVTLVGLPFGLGLLLFLLPALWFLGYIVAGARLGRLITERAKREGGVHPYLATFIGLIVLQLIVLIPVIGWLIAAVAGFWGAGALAAVAFRAAGGRGFTPPATQTPASQPQPVA